MSPRLESVEADALQLTAAERGLLVERLIASLDSDSEVEKAWAAEAERRHAEIKRGEVTLLSVSETLAELRAEFG